jgi:hypothetical protein
MCLGSTAKLGVERSTRFEDPDSLSGQTEIYLNTKYRRGVFRQAESEVGVLYRNTRGDTVATEAVEFSLKKSEW